MIYFKVNFSEGKYYCMSIINVWNVNNLIFTDISFYCHGRCVNITLWLSCGKRSKPQLKDRRGHPWQTPPSFARTSLIPLDFSSYHSIQQIMHPATDGFTWDSCVTSSFLSHCTRTESIQLSFLFSHTHHFPKLQRPCLWLARVSRNNDTSV